MTIDTIGLVRLTRSNASKCVTGLCLGQLNPLERRAAPHLDAPPWDIPFFDQFTI